MGGVGGVQEDMAAGHVELETTSLWSDPPRFDQAA